MKSGSTWMMLGHTRSMTFWIAVPLSLDVLMLQPVGSWSAPQVMVCTGPTDALVHLAGFPFPAPIPEVADEAVEPDPAPPGLEAFDPLLLEHAVAMSATTSPAPTSHRVRLDHSTRTSRIRRGVPRAPT